MICNFLADISSEYPARLYILCVNKQSCKNPTCKSTFFVFPSETGRKLYCSRKCRSEHHWSGTELFKKPCKNPTCSAIISRKFQSKLDRVHYCSDECKKSHKKCMLQKFVESFCSACGETITSKRQPCGKLVARTMCDECLKADKIRVANEQLRVIRERYEVDDQFRKKIKAARKLQGKEMRKKHEREGLSPAWINWYKNFSSAGRSSIEDSVVAFLKEKVKTLERWYQISNMFVDIYIPEKNLVIECQGDYWHMNPAKYGPKDYNTTINRTAEQQWEKDRRRRKFMERAGYNVVELWESEIKRGDYSKLDIYL